MRRIRSFIAVVLSEQVKFELGKIIEQLQKNRDIKKYSKAITWVDPKNAHITLIFLGHIGEDRVKIAGSLLEKAANRFSEFEVEWTSLSYFFSDRDSSDSVIFLNIKDKDNILKDLYKDFANELEQEAFYPPQRFSAHITIARLKKLKTRDEQSQVLESITSEEINKIIIPISTIGVFESSRFEGQKYRMLKRVQLKSV